MVGGQGAGEGLKRHMAFPGEGDVKEGSREEVAIELILKNE